MEGVCNRSFAGEDIEGAKSRIHQAIMMLSLAYSGEYRLTPAQQQRLGEILFEGWYAALDAAVEAIRQCRVKQ